MAEGSQAMTSFYAKRIIGDSVPNTTQALLQINSNNTYLLKHNSYIISHLAQYDDTNQSLIDEKIIFLNGNTEKISLGIGTGNADLAGNFQVDGNSIFNGNVTINGTTIFNNHIYIKGNHDIYMAHGNQDYLILQKEDNVRHIMLNSTGGIETIENEEETTSEFVGYLSLGWQNTPIIRMYSSSIDSSTPVRYQYFTINPDGAYANDTLGVGGQDINYKLYVNGTGYFSNELTAVNISTINTTTNGSQFRMRFSDKNNSIYGIMQTNRVANSGAQICFEEYSEDSNGVLLNYKEQYILPVATENLSANASYNILTTKNLVTVAQGGTSANNYVDARINLHTCRWFVSQTDVLNQIIANVTNGDQAVFFSVDGTTYTGTPTNTSWYDIISCTPSSVGNATTLLAKEYGSSHNLYVGYVWKNGTSQPTWKQIVLGDGTGITNPASFRAATGTWALISDSYNTFMPADGTTNGWYKFGTSNTSYGILPSASGSIGSGHNYIGTSSWYWKYSYIDEMYTHQLIVQGATNATMTSASTNPRITFQEGTSSQPVHLIYSDYDNYRAPAGLKVIGGTSATPAWFEVEGSIYSGASVYVTHAGECGLEVDNTQTTNPHKGGFIVGTGGNLGIYDRTKSKWVVYSDPSGNVVLNGNATTASSCSGNAASASKVGEAATWLYFNHSNEVNFGGTGTSDTIYFGYRATDSRPKPATFIFGTGSAMATVKAATFVGALTGNVTGNCSGSSGSCTGNAAGLSGGLVTNTVTSNGNLAVTTAKGSYYGINLGHNASGMSIMSINASHQGLYNQTNSQWIVYYNAASSSKSIVIGSSTVNITGGISLNLNTKLTGNFEMTGNQTITGAGAHWTKWVNTTTGVSIEMWSDTTNQGIYTRGYWTGSAYTASAGWILYRGTDSYLHTQFRLYGAVWNDYAEFRKGDVTTPGRVLIEQHNGIMALCNERLAAGAKIISDTYGFAIGETKECKTPIAVSGRVLVYPYRNRNEYELGAAVCSAPGGTIDIMTRDEIMRYPERIVGTVSEIPTYEVWYGESKENPISIPINGRIWIYVR